MKTIHSVMNNYIRIVIVLTVFFVFENVSAQHIVPNPNFYKLTDDIIRIPNKITIKSYDKEFKALVPNFITNVSSVSSLKIEEKKHRGFIAIKRNKNLDEIEQYRITATPKGIIIEAGNIVGCYYGLQSVQQILLSSLKQENVIQSFIIEDKPRFSWRGIMLDESRHFMGKEEVKKLLDMMALHKLNKFHWHLTDASGWRIEIKQYPLLTEVGGVGNHTDPNADARFYTQEDIHEIVAYATERFIEVIPEIDMPGHASSAVRAYPEHSGGGSKAYPDFTFNPGKEETYTFLTNILKEVTTLFPTQYLHVGGDEVHFGNEEWNLLPDVKKLMKQYRLNDLKEVELYFIKRMSDSISKMGKTLIGWDEIITANLPKDNSMIMWWRHDKPEGLIKAIEKEYPVVLCPRIPLYFDFIQHSSHKYGRLWSKGEFAPIESVYNFPETNYVAGISLNNPLVLGIQGNIWTERIQSTKRMQFMTYPRLSALAESAWTYEENKDFGKFNHRMNQMFEIYRKRK